MSDRPTNVSPDWRRQSPQQRREADAASEELSPPGNGESLETEEEEVASRTLFSFLEPSLNTVATFGAPLVIAGIVGLIVGIVLVSFVGSMRLYGFITIGLGVALIGLVGLISLSAVFAAFISRTGRYGVNSLIMLGAFLGILVVTNVISFGNNSRIDVTATNQFSLATSTRDLLKALDQPVHAIAFYKEDTTLSRTLDPEQRSAAEAAQIIRKAKVRETLTEFRSRSGKFTFEFKDPDLEPEITRNYFGAVPTGFVNESIIIEGLESNIIDTVQPSDQAYSRLEQDLYTGVLVATGKEQKSVYFLTGHRERSIASSASDGYSSLRQALEADNYKVQSLLWDPEAEEAAVPDDAGLVIVAGPAAEFPDAHAQALDLYLRGKNADGTDRREGGRLIFLAEPDTPQSFKAFLARWGVVVGDGYIRDLERSVPATPHTIRLSLFDLRRMPQDLIAQIPGDVLQALQEITIPKGIPLDVVYMPGAASLGLIDDGQGLRYPVPLGSSSLDAYLINDIERTEPITDAGDQSDPRGPFSPAVFVQALGPLGTPPPAAGSTPSSMSRLVVFGDADFLANGPGNTTFTRGSGADLVLNSANYLLGDFSLVSIRNRAFTYREFNLDKNQHNFVRFSSWFFLPGLMGLLAGLVWWLRR